MLSNVVIFSILCSDSPLDFHDKTWDALVKNLKYFLDVENIKQLCNIPEEKYFAPLRILYPFIKSFVNAFVGSVSIYLMGHSIQVYVLICPR